MTNTAQTQVSVKFVVKWRAQQTLLYCIENHIIQFLLIVFRNKAIEIRGRKKPAHSFAMLRILYL
jgi:hypothetical protein